MFTIKFIDNIILKEWNLLYRFKFGSFKYSYYICNMKYKVIITLLMVLFVGNMADAQSFHDNNNRLLGTVESDGTVRNANNMRLGKIYDDGAIRDNNNRRVGIIEKDGTIRNNNNMRLGTVSSDGVVRDNNNVRLGTISSDGAVRNNNNMRIGTASGINPKYAAILFFFDLL